MATINAPYFSLTGFVLLSAPVLWASGFPTEQDLLTLCSLFPLIRLLQVEELNALCKWY
jgi:hypothetical protein